MIKTLFQLFLAFAKIGFTSFGGTSMIPLIMEEMLSHNWMTADDVANIVAIAEMTPGSLGVNCATFAGTQTAGVLGGTAAVIGVLTPTLTLTLVAALFFQKFRESKNDKKGKIVQRSQLCDHLVGRRDTMNAESNEMLPVSEKYMLTIKEAGHYYNRAMGGSFSIKSVLPAIFPNDPELNYHNLEGVHNGSEAMTIFPRIKDMPAEEQKKARHNLLKYCELDTYAMVKVWGELVRVVKGDTEDGD